LQTNELIQWETVSANVILFAWNLTYPDDFHVLQTNELIQWETVSANVTMFTWNLTYPDDFMYGVSATTPQGQSGLHWESCIYTQNIRKSNSK
jgi:hypothetical protein